MKLASKQIAEHLYFIYNLSFTTGIFWDILKIAAVTPVYKKDSKLECSKYRPISLLSNLDKIIWIKNLCIKANGILSDQKILYKNNLGFKKKSYLLHICMWNICIKNIEKAIDNKVFVCGVFFWLAKSIWYSWSWHIAS